MLESPDAIRNTEAIAGVPAIDVLFIGTSNLSATFGISGQIGHPRIIEAYQAVDEACRRCGESLGMSGIYYRENAARYVAMGARFLLTGSDQSYIMSGASERAAFFNALPHPHG